MKWQICFGCSFGVSINNRCKQSIMNKYTEKSHVDKIIEESLRWWNKSWGFSFLEKWANRGEAWFTMPVFSWMHPLNCKWIILLPTYFPPWNSLIVRLAEMCEAHCLLRVKENSNPVTVLHLLFVSCDSIWSKETSAKTLKMPSCCSCTYQLSRDRPWLSLTSTAFFSS